MKRRGLITPSLQCANFHVKVRGAGRALWQSIAAQRIRKILRSPCCHKNSLSHEIPVFVPGDLSKAMDDRQQQQQPPASQSQDLSEFETYEEYLDSQITSTDLFYLENKTIARQLVELGYRGSGDIISRHQFNDLKSKPQSQSDKDSLIQKIESSAAKEETPFVRALMDREDDILQEKLASIVYIRSIDQTSREVSAYIDLSDRLALEKSFQKYSTKNIDKSTETTLMQPRKSDLSWFDFGNGQSLNTDSEHFQVIADHPNGLVFQHKKDRKAITVWPSKVNAERIYLKTCLDSPEYEQVVFYDLDIQRKI